MLTEKQLKEELHALAAEETREAYVSAILTFGGSLCKDEKGYISLWSRRYRNIAVDRCGKYAYPHRAKSEYCACCQADKV